MRIALVLLIVVGCDKGEPAKPKPPPPPKPVPASPYIVRYDCFHSDMPFGKGSQYRNDSYDLGRKVYIKQWYELTSDEPNAVGDQKVPQPVESPLSDARVTAINAAAEKVLRGGPYKPEYPVPEGTPCTLAISAGGKEVFTLEKAATEIKDDASALIGELHQ